VVVVTIVLGGIDYGFSRFIAWLLSLNIHLG
jgi:hypothetical protein